MIYSNEWMILGKTKDYGGGNSLNKTRLSSSRMNSSVSRGSLAGHLEELFTAEMPAIRISGYVLSELLMLSQTWNDSALDSPKD